MRIGLITGEYPPMRGGVGAYSAILADHLARAGHTLFIFSDPQARSDSFPLAHTAGGWGWSALWAFRQWARENRLDILNLQFQTAAYQMSPLIHFAPDWAGAPLVTTFHDLRVPYLFPKAGLVREWIVGRLARASAGVIATNHEDFARLAHLPQEALIPIGSNILPAAAEQITRADAGAGEDDFLIAYFGLMNHSKGVDTLLQAIAQARAAGVPARLVVIGGEAGASDPTNAAYNEQITALTSELGLNAFVTRTGFVRDADVAGYLTCSDVVALPFRDGASFRRGSLMAPLWYGCPIMTTTPSVAIPEFRDGENMRLLPPDDVAAWAAGLAELYRDRAAGARLGHGAKILAARFDWGAIAEQTATFFERVLKA